MVMELDYKNLQKIALKYTEYLRSGCVGTFGDADINDSKETEETKP